MAKGFLDLIKEIDITFRNIIIFSNILASIIIFLSIYLFLAFIKFYPFLAIIPAIVYLAIDSYVRARKKYYREVEKAYPILNEKLRTAADNLYANNIMVAELKNEIMQDIKKVKVGSFVNQRNTSYKILACVLLCFGILFVSTLNVGFDIKLMFQKNPFYNYNIQGGNETGTGESGDERSAGGGTSDEIFGEPEVAELGQELFDFSITSSGYEINLDDIKEVERKEFQELFPGTDSVFSSSGVYEENIPKEQQQLVKNYFKTINE